MLFTGNGSAQSTCVSQHPPTEDGGEAYPKLAVEADFTCTPEALFKLMYREKDFMAQVREEESSVHGTFKTTLCPSSSELTLKRTDDIKIGEWTPVGEGEEGVESRELSYTMSLSHAVGPSQTCKYLLDLEYIQTLKHPLLSV